MKILFSLTYYRPHISGLTLYVQRLAEAFVQAGHEVTVLTSQYEPGLPKEEMLHGVRVVRCPVFARVSKGVLMPGFVTKAWKLVGEHDVVSVHLPQLEASLITLVTRLRGKPAVLTYHCDLQLPKGWFNRVVDQVVFLSNYVAGWLSNRIVAYTQDYAQHSRLLSRFLSKIEVILPPVPPLPLTEKAQADFREQHQLEGKTVLGMATRVATEKGVEYLLEAIPLLLQKFPQLQVLHAGEYENVLGEQEYFERLRPLLEEYQAHYTFLGILPPEEMGPFFANLDALVVASINSTESFGLVQVEAMMCGTPVVSTNLPGVREPIRMTGMGKVVPLRDSAAIAAGLSEILEQKDKFLVPRDTILKQFDLSLTLESYTKLFQSLIQKKPEPQT